MIALWPPAGRQLNITFQLNFIFLNLSSLILFYQRKHTNVGRYQQNYMCLKDNFKFNFTYFALTIILLIVEILIAKYVHDQIVRPYVGDFLVVILIYCFVKTFFDFAVIATSIFVLIFAFLVETLQYFNFLKFAGLGKSSIAKVIMGTHFEWIDIFAYISGIGLVITVEKLIANGQIKRNREA